MVVDEDVNDVDVAECDDDDGGDDAIVLYDGDVYY